MSGESPVDWLSVAQAVRIAVEEMPDVARISYGRFARVGTFGPFKTVPGVVMIPVQGGVNVDVHVIALSSAESLPDLANEIRQVTRQTALAHGIESMREINVIIEGLRDKESPG